MRSNAYPRDLASNSGRTRVTADAANPNHRIELHGSNSTHAVVGTEASICIRVTGVRALQQMFDELPEPCKSLKEWLLR
jgi:hypothetical protein